MASDCIVAMKIQICNDIEWLLSAEAFNLYSYCMYQPTYDNYKKSMKLFLSNEFVNIYICETEKKKVGMLVIDKTASVSEIVGIAVSKECRRHGIGKQMIFEIMELEHLELIKAQTDEDAIGFYRNCGFSEQKSVIEYPNGCVTRYDCVLGSVTTPRL